MKKRFCTPTPALPYSILVIFYYWETWLKLSFFLYIELYVVSCTDLDDSVRDFYKMTLSQPQIKVSVIQLLQVASFKFLRRFDVVPNNKRSLFMIPHSIESKKAFLLFYIWQSFLTWSLGFYEVVKMHFEHFAINLTHPTSTLSAHHVTQWLKTYSDFAGKLICICKK